MIESKVMERYFFFGLLLATLLFTFLIFRPFLIVLALGVAFSIVLYPIHEWFLRLKVPPWFSALLVVIIFALLFWALIFGIGTLVFNQSQSVYTDFIRGSSGGQFITRINIAVSNILPGDFAIDFGEKLSDLLGLISKNIAKIFSTTLEAIFSFILVLLSIFYFLKDGERWRQALVILSPLADRDDEKIISRLKLSVNGVIKGYLLVALVQGVLMGVGLWLFGVPKPALWGVVAAIMSLVPTIGTALVSVPAFIYLFLTGSTALAFGFLIWAAVIVGTIDNFLSPFLVSRKIDIPPLFILFSVLGGIALLGPVGVLIGPLAVSLLYTLISIYRNELKQSPTF